MEDVVTPVAANATEAVETVQAPIEQKVGRPLVLLKNEEAEEIPLEAELGSRDAHVLGRYSPALVDVKDGLAERLVEILRVPVASSETIQIGTLRDLGNRYGHAVAFDLINRTVMTLRDLGNRYERNAKGHELHPGGGGIPDVQDVVGRVQIPVQVRAHGALFGLENLKDHEPCRRNRERLAGQVLIGVPPHVGEHPGRAIEHVKNIVELVSVVVQICVRLGDGLRGQKSHNLSAHVVLNSLHTEVCSQTCPCVEDVEDVVEESARHFESHDTEL